MPRVIQTRSVLAVRNLAVATDHYVNVLGFTRDPIDAEGWSFLSLGTFKVMLGECPDAMPASALGDHSYFVHVMVEERGRVLRGDRRAGRADSVEAREQAVGPSGVRSGHARRPPDDDWGTVDGIRQGRRRTREGKRQTQIPGARYRVRQRKPETGDRKPEHPTV